MLGPPGFDTVVRLVRACDCYQLEYSDLDEAIRGLKDLVRGRSSPESMH